MPSWAAVLAFLKALLEAVKPYLKPLGTAVVAVKLQDGARAEKTVEKVLDADEAVAQSRGWSPDDRMRFLKDRGRLRDL
jgi:hypothetical protein